MPEAEINLSQRFGLHRDYLTQDWAVTNANARLLPVLLETLATSSLSDDERYALMELTIASMDEALQIDVNEKDNKKYLSLLASLLREHPCLYASAIAYWAEPVILELDEEQQFLVSGYMATLWRQILPNLEANHAIPPLPAAHLTYSISTSASGQQEP